MKEHNIKQYKIIFILAYWMEKKEYIGRLEDSSIVSARGDSLEKLKANIRHSIRTQGTMVVKNGGLEWVQRNIDFFKNEVTPKLPEGFKTCKIDYLHSEFVEPDK